MDENVVNAFLHLFVVFLNISLEGSLGLLCMLLDQFFDGKLRQLRHHFSGLLLVFLVQVRFSFHLLGAQVAARAFLGGLDLDLSFKRRLQRF